jgi:biotin carboxyl carrier protein
MKMQNELKAPRDGEVSGIRVGPGDSVDQNQALLTLS